MPRFFVTPPVGNTAVIDGADGAHIRRALRMREGETLTLCDGCGTDYQCHITGFEGDAVQLCVDAVSPNGTEPTTRVTLYMGLPKADKLEWVIQKAVELGVSAVVPVTTARSIVKLDAKDAAKKQERWQRIAAEAAGQSGRGIIPVVEAPISFQKALSRWEKETLLTFYEGGGENLAALVNEDSRELSVFVGPEGGIAPEELAAMQAVGAHVATLGPRILRCETAPVAALAVIMQLTGNM
ncbi:MAG: 16S rRNA (uracil(1498)-N(3))-methyltransferase [Clostridia bacterium]|nr:16S rRNA (uracil(1498)-N(3))-methyltransferase [Clostridia bacterium]